MRPASESIMNRTDAGRILYIYTDKETTGTRTQHRQNQTEDNKKGYGKNAVSQHCAAS